MLKVYKTKYTMDTYFHPAYNLCSTKKPYFLRSSAFCTCRRNCNSTIVSTYEVHYSICVPILGNLKNDICLQEPREQCVKSKHWKYQLTPLITTSGCQTSNWRDCKVSLSGKKFPLLAVVLLVYNQSLFPENIAAFAALFFALY